MLMPPDLKSVILMKKRIAHLVQIAVYATIRALGDLKTREQVATLRNKKVEEI